MRKNKKRSLCSILLIFAFVISLIGYNYRSVSASTLNFPLKISDIFNQDTNLADTIAAALGSTYTRDSIINNQSELDTITTLNANGKNITKIDGIGSLTNLQKLNLSNNNIASIPAEIKNLVNLQNLNLSNNKIPSIPTEIQGLAKLQNLDLSNNVITALPTEIGDLGSLVTLNLGNNKISSLPQQMSQLSSLINLSIYSNSFTTVPAVISSLGNLQAIKIDDNSIKDMTIIEGLSSSITKSCNAQKLSEDLSAHEFSQTATFPYTLPEIFSGNRMTVTSGTATISSDKKTANLPLNTLGANSVVITVDSGIAPSSTLTLSYTVTDTTPPNAPVIDTSLNNLIANTARPTITGAAEANSKIYLTIDGTSTTTFATTNSSGRWSYALTSDLSIGNHTITAKAQDASNNLSTASNPITVTIDTTKSNTPVITSPGNNIYTTSQNPSIYGTSLGMTYILVNIDGKDVSSTVQASASGNWNYTPQTALKEGKHTIYARSKNNTTGDLSPSSNQINVNIDRTAPPKPIVTATLNDSSFATRYPTITGTAENNSIIRLKVDGVDDTGAAVTSSAGKWSYTISRYIASEGNHTIIARAIDAAGNVSPDSTSITIKVDLTVPPIPSIDGVGWGTYINSKKPTLTGTAEAGDKVILNIDAKDISTPPVTDSKGKWKYTVTNELSEGYHYIYARAQDPAGNISSIASYLVFIDSTAPPVPTIISPANSAVTNNAKPQIVGTITDITAQIIVCVDGKDLSPNAVPNSSGNWVFTPSTAISDGTHKITAKAIDAAKNVSSPSSEISITIDTTPPKKPTITSPANRTLTNSTKLSLSGSGEKGSIITLNIDGKDYVNCTTTDSTGKWNYNLPDSLANGNHTITAKAKDAVGNLGDSSDPVLVTVDLALPVVAFNEIGKAGNTNSPNPKISGTVKPNSKVFITVDGKENTNPVVADNDGNWKYAITTKLVEGYHAITARAQDPAGNISTVNPTVKICVDLTKPDKPLIKTTVTDILTNNQSYELDGTAEPNANIIVSVDRVVQSNEIVADSDGNWSFVPQDVLPEGKHVITAKAVDPSGNIGDSSDPINITIDLTPPKTPFITSPITGQYFTKDKITVNGTGDIATRIILNIDGQDISEGAIVDKDGNYSIPIGNKIPSGKHIIFATSTDDAQNTSNATTPVAITISLKAPGKPTIKLPLTNSKTKDSKPLFSGTADPDNMVILNISLGKKTTVAGAKVNTNGTWSVKLQKKLSPGKYKVTAISKDPAKRHSPPSAPIYINISK